MVCAKLAAASNFRIRFVPQVWTSRRSLLALAVSVSVDFLHQYPGFDHDRPQAGIGGKPLPCLFVGCRGELGRIGPSSDGLDIILLQRAGHVDQVEIGGHPHDLARGKKSLQFAPWNLCCFAIDIGANLFPVLVQQILDHATDLMISTPSSGLL